MNLSQIISPERWRLIVTVAAALAVVLIIAVLALQIMEFQYYRQSPSAWPSATHLK